MSELQVGGLALVIGANHCHENIGKIVKVDGFYKAGEELPSHSTSGQDVFVCSGDNLLYSMVIKGTNDLIGKISGTVAYCWPQHLTPIRPEADPLDVTHKEELHA